MYKHILIPTDGSRLSAAALRKGIDLARSCGARVTLLTSSMPIDALSPEFSIDPKGYRRVTAQVASERLLPALAYAGKRGVKAQGVHAHFERPWQAIVRTARRRGCDLVFMASHGRGGLDALLLGSETQRVLAHTKLPVLVCR